MSDFLPRLKAEVTTTKDKPVKGLALLKAVAMQIEQNRKEPDKLMEIAEALRSGGNELMTLVTDPPKEPWTEFQPGVLAPMVKEVQVAPVPSTPPTEVKSQPPQPK